MRKIINLPTNKSFFGRYAHLLPTLKTSSFIAQLISAITEIGVIWTLIYVKVDALLPHLAFAFATIGAILGTLFLELGLRILVPFSVNAFLYKRFKGLDRIISIFIILMCLILVSASGFLSFNGSKEIIENLSTPPILESTKATEQSRKNRLNEVNLTYTTDVNSTEKTVDDEMIAIAKSFNAKIAEQNVRLKRYERREQRTGKSFRTTKDNISAKIAQLESLKANQIAQLEHKKSKDLANLLSEKTSTLKALESKYDSEIESIKSKNQKAIQQSESKIVNYGLGLGWFTIICLCLFIIMAIIIEVIKKGSGIEEIAVANQFDFEENIIVVAWQAIWVRVHTYFRNHIHNFSKNTPPPPQPLPPSILYDQMDAKNQIIKIEVDQSSKEHLTDDQLPSASISKNRFHIIRNQRSQNLNSDAPIFEEIKLPISIPYSPTKPNPIGGIKPTKKTITYMGLHNEIEPRVYTYSKVTSLISKHRKRVAEAKVALSNGGGKREENALKNNQMRLEYWQNRVKEFFE